MSCFDSFRSAISHATGGRVKDAPLDARVASTDRSFEEKINRSPATHDDDYSGCCTILSIEYDWKNYYDYGSITFRASSGCDGSFDIDWMTGYVGDHWNDGISSFRGYNGCIVKHWENRDFRGVSTEWQAWDNDMGIMVNKTSSIQWA